MRMTTNARPKEATSFVYPVYTPGEKLADAFVHITGLLFALVGIGVMMFATASTHSASTVLTVSIYAVCLLLMLSCSAAYHMVPLGRWKVYLRRLDRSAIFLKIAGTYTPFALLKMGGIWGIGLFSVVWLLAAMGIFMILLVRQGRSNFIVLLYLALGWAGIMVLWPLVASLSSTAVWYLFAGGILYSVGTIFYIFYYLPFANVIWHVFVLVATICHYFAVYDAVLIDVA